MSRPDMRPVDEGDHLVTIDDFAECVRRHYYIDYDGFAEWATETHVSDKRVDPSGFLKAKRPTWATHVAWYNR